MQQTEKITEAENQPEKKLFIKTYGCQMNFYDSEKMQSSLANDGFSITDNMAESDLLIINTCHIREKASEKMYSELGRLLKVKNARKKDGKNTVIAVAGCVAQAEGAFIKQRAPYVDIVVGPQSYSRLPMMVNNAEKGQKNNIDLDFSVVDKFDFLNEEIEREHSKTDIIPVKHEVNEVKPAAFLTIQEGCDKFCTFCVVPYTRGAEYSRPVHEIYREALNLVAKGTREINLLGQNVNAYHGKAPDGSVWNIRRLIEHLANIPLLERIKYTTSHPKDCDDSGLYEAHKYVEKLMPFVHLPVQSGSNRILEAMNRKHTRDDYFKIIDKFSSARPDIEFSSDFIIGFPSETEAEFMDTIDLIEQVKFSLSYSFIFSARSGTPAANMADDVPMLEKTARLHKVQQLLETQMFEFIDNKVGKILPVHISRMGKFEGQVQGFTPYGQPVILENAADQFNRVVMAEITARKDRALLGKLNSF